MCQVVTYKKLKAMGNDKTIRPIKWSQLLIRGGCLQEVFIIRICLENFGVLDRWLLVIGGCLLEVIPC